MAEQDRAPDGVDLTGTDGTDGTDGAPRTVLGAVARGGALMLRDLLLNGGVLFSLVVGIGGVMTGAQPWIWLGPVIGIAGVALSFAGHRERVVSTPRGQTRRSVLPGWAIWLVAVGVPVAAAAVMAAMWV